MRVDADKAHNYCYTIEELVVIDFRLTLGWSGSAGFWGVMSTTVAHAHCNTTIVSAQLLDEGTKTMAHVKVVERWEDGKTSTNTAGRKS